jgi:hypothetical protein
LKARLGKEFERKNLEQLRYFFVIEVACGVEGIVLSQRKYILDLLIETYMLGYKSVISPIDVNANISIDMREQVDHKRY